MKIQLKCHTPTEILAAAGQHRRISRLTNQQVEVRWNRIVLHMRLIDLHVLRQEFEDLLATHTIESEEDYVLTINRQPLYLTRAELRDFWTMVSNATDCLPSVTVRWKELTLSLRPYDPQCSGSAMHFSHN